VEGHVGSLGEEALLVQVAENSVLFLDELHTGLVVVVGNILPLDLLLLVLLLLSLEGELDEDLVELLITKVDTELLKAVPFKDLEAVDIQHSDQETLVVLPVHQVVRAQHNPVKELSVPERKKKKGGREGEERVRSQSSEKIIQRLGERVARVGGLLGAEGAANGLGTSGDGLGGKGLLECVRGDTEDPGGNVQNLSVVNGGGTLGVRLELQVANMKDAAHHPEDLDLFVLGHANNVHGVPHFSVVAGIVDSVHLVAAALVQVAGEKLDRKSVKERGGAQ